MKSTDQQLQAIDAVHAGNSTKIRAGAGCGKTSTLVEIGHAMPQRRILYLAYNKAMADDAASRMPDNVTARTINSMAFGRAGVPFKHRLSQRLTGTQAAEYAGIMDYLEVAQNILLTPSAAGYFLQDWVGQFCHSADDQISFDHIRPAAIEELLPPDAITRLDKDPDILFRYRDEVGQSMLRYAQKTWARMTDVNDNMPITHDIYLKLFALSKPKLPFDLIMLDESQDANAVILQILQSQSAQGVFVGDSFQQLYAWRGAVDAMTKIETQKTVDLTQSFRFGPAIADMANAALEHFLGVTDFRLQGTPTLNSRLEHLDRPSAVLARTNASAIAHALQQKAAGRSVGFSGGTKELKAMVRAAEQLQRGASTEYQEFANFRSWEELVDHSKTRVGRDLKTFVTLVDNHGTYGLTQLLDGLVRNSEDADCLVATVHKAKGQEYDSVLLADDFMDKDAKGFTPAEGNVAYVAITRARQSLDPYGCEAFKPCVLAVASMPGVAVSNTQSVLDPGTRLGALETARVATPPAVSTAQVALRLPLRMEEWESLRARMDRKTLEEELAAYLRAKYLKPAPSVQRTANTDFDMIDLY
jgi:hypothetical protein